MWLDFITKLIFIRWILNYIIFKSRIKVDLLNFISFFVSFILKEYEKLYELFVFGFCHQITRFVTLINTLGNQIKILVEIFVGGMYFTWGWYSLRDFYDIHFGVRVTLVYVSVNQFVITLRDIFDASMLCHSHDIPIQFILE